MKGSQRLFQVACRVVVVTWLGAYLAWSVADAEAPPVESTARVAPVPEPTPAPAPAPPPEPAPAPRSAEAEAAVAEPTHVGRDEIARGTALLDGGGDFPALSCTYESFDSFRGYAQAMVDLGARFVVVRDREIVGGVEVATGRLAEPALDAAYSPRARDYTGEPALAALSRAVRSRFGSTSVVMMLVPRDLDAGLFGGISRALAERGRSHGDYSEIRGRYERAPRGGVWLRVDSAVRMDGRQEAMDLLFDLGAIARAGGIAVRPSA